MTNTYNHVLYTGVTGDLVERVRQHRAKEIEGFTKKYNVTKLVYYEAYEEPSSAILREKQIKGVLGKRRLI
jgi:putative endonuclease